MKCCKCDNSKDAKAGKRGEKLPRGWKRHWSSQLVYCPDCWGKAFRVAAISIAVVGPREKEQWPELREQLQTAWGQARNVANFIHAKRFSAEAWGGKRGEKIPAAPEMKPMILGCKTHYYDCRAIAPDLVPKTVSAIDHAESRKYSKTRYKLVWTGESSLASARYPRPLPMDDECFKLLKEDDGRIFLRTRLTAKGERFDLKLDIGPNERRQKTMLEKCISGEYGVIEATLYQTGARKSDHRTAVESKRPATRIMCKVVAWIPVATRAATLDQRFFSIKSDKDSFLYGILENREQPWVLNADHVRDWCYQHSRNLRRLSQDRKAEMRTPRARRLRRNRDLEQRCNKHHDRIKTFTDTTARMVVNFAVRNRVTRIKWDDSERGYFACQEASFPWAALENRLKQVCHEVGITLDVASGEVVAPNGGPLANSITTGDET